MGTPPIVCPGYPYSPIVRGILTTNGGQVVHRRAISDVNGVITANDYIVAYTSLTASRTLTLPAPVSGIFQQFIIKDESGSAGTFSIVVSGTIDGATNKAINTNYGDIRIYTNGVAWFSW